VHGRLQEDKANTDEAQAVLEEKTTNSILTSVPNATTNRTMPSLSAISSTENKDDALFSMTTNTSRTTLQNNNKNNKTKAFKTPENIFSAWASDMASKPKEKKPQGKSKENPIKTPETLISNKRGDELLTVADLEEILRASGYVRKADLLQLPSPDKNPKTKSGNVAIPQMSVLSYRGLTLGTTISSGFLAMILSITILPNLWLIGIIFGALYGYEVSKDYKDKPPNSILSRIVVATGRRLAKAYLYVYDFLHGIWFMYKTGQLSYEYYKQYSKLDDRFGIGEKMDAWNARFIEGKKKFDAWERDNEVSRRMLAGLRTAWLVEQQSLNKGRGTRSKYRIVQYGYDVMTWFGRFWTAVWNTMTGGGSSQLQQVLKGIRIHISESRMQTVGPRIGAALLALVIVSMVGAIFSVAPKLLGLVAIMTGLIWPTWVPELVDRFSSLLDEFKTKGRGEEYPVESGIPTALSQFGMYDKKRYFYYRRENGNKKWYRTGRPAFRSDENTSDGKGLLGGLSNDKAKKGKDGKKATTAGKKAKTSGKQQWGLFGW
jgi:hypothetical protein